MPTRKRAAKTADTTATAAATEDNSTATATASTAEVTVGDTVHYHREDDGKPTGDTALPATVLHVDDKKSLRLDLLVHDKEGNPFTARDVQHSAMRKAGAWSHRTA